MEKEKLNPCIPLFYWGFGFSLIIFYADVMSTSEILRLIQLCPSPKAEKIKLWIAELAVKGRKIVKCLENAIKKAKDLIRCRAANIIMTIEFHEFDIHGDAAPHELL